MKGKHILISLRLSKPNVQKEIESVDLLIQNFQGMTLSKAKGSLPSIDNIEKIYNDLTSQHNNHIQSFRGKTIDGIEIEPLPLQLVAVEEVRLIYQQLKDATNSWLDSESFSVIKDLIVRHLESLENSDSAEFLIQVDNDSQIIQYAPFWYAWDVIQKHPKTGISFSKELGYDREKAKSYQSRYFGSFLKDLKHLLKRMFFVQEISIPKILVVFGDSTNICFRSEEELIMKLQHTKKAVCNVLNTPRPDQLIQELRNDSYDILIYSGHSSAAQGMWIGHDEFVKSETLIRSFRKSIDQGLKLVIFNSCDSSNLVEHLNNLGVPAAVHMRDLIPDVTARFFLDQFFQNLLKNECLYLVLREVIDALDEVAESCSKGHSPCAPWLPILHRNSTSLLSLTWSDLGSKKDVLTWKTFILTTAIFLLSASLIFYGKRIKVHSIISLCRDGSCMDQDPQRSKCAPSKDFPSISLPDSLRQNVGSSIDTKGQYHNYNIELRFSQSCQSKWLRLESEQPEAIRGHKIYLEDGSGKQYVVNKVPMQLTTPDYYSDMVPGSLRVRACSQPLNGELICTKFHPSH